MLISLTFAVSQLRAKPSKHKTFLSRTGNIQFDYVITVQQTVTL